MIPNIKDFNKLIGMGVAIQCDDDFVRKFKVLAVSVCHDGNGQRVSGIAVDAPRRQSEYWKRVGWLRRDGDWWWMYPLFVFRSKGECLRHYADEGIAQANRSIERFRKQIEEHQQALDALKKLIQAEEDKKYEYVKRKWFRNSTTATESGGLD